MQTSLEAQVRVSRMLGYGFIFSVTWLGGIGALLAVIIGVKARRIIKRSEGELAGLKMAWWCIIVGAIGMAIMLPYLIHLIMKAFSDG